MNHWHPGEPWPLGATCTRTGVNFALFSAHADRVALCLFDESGRETNIPVRTRTGDIWHIHINDLVAGQIYGYRVYGLWDPESGHRFNGTKLLIDPYAKALTNIPRVHASSYDYEKEPSAALNREPSAALNKEPSAHEEPSADSNKEPSAHEEPSADSNKEPSAAHTKKLSPSTIDNSAHIAKCIVVNDLQPSPHFDSVRLADALIYELHVKGFTRLHPDVEQNQQGRYLGLGSEKILDYLKDLGVTSLELLPIQEFVDEPFLTNRGLVNYWGYNPLCYFIPTHRYAVSDPRAEFSGMVNRVHDAGLEIILDVVYNHTTEGDHRGPTLSFRGIDNASYYRLDAADRGVYINDSGCGNSLNAANPAVLHLVMDSLRFWVAMGVDGFRFDLTTSLGRNESGFSSQAAFFQAIQQDPVLNRVKLIAEPWDLGMGGYQLGQFPKYWSEWNDQYRDTVQRFWRGDTSVLPEFARQVHGASELFEESGRPPQSTINLITSHDGFTLADLVSYSEKNNAANLEANDDGHGENYNFNCGAEGDTNDTGILGLRAKQQRNLLTTLMVSQGVPMILAGDELGRTQHGNNNSYCQDNELNWMDWSLMNNSRNRQLLQYTQRLIGIRKTWGELRSERFIHGINYSHYESLDEIEWYHPRGEPMLPADWENPTLFTLGLMLHGAAIFPDRECGTRLILVVFNVDENPVAVAMPALPLPGFWHCQLSSAEKWAEMPLNISPGTELEMEAKSVSLFEYRDDEDRDDENDGEDSQHV